MYDVMNAYLENGLRVVLHKEPKAKTVSCGLWIKQGSKHETDENNGCSHLIEHLVINPKNENNLIYTELADRVSQEGVIYNAATTKEYTCFYYTGLKNTLDICLSCLEHIAMNNRKFNSDFLENEKSVVLQEAKSFYSSFQQIKERTSQAIWGNVGIGKIIMGDVNVVSNVQAEKLEEFIDTTYVPENAIIVVTGNIEYDATLDMIEEKFGKWKDKKKKIDEELIESLPGVYFNKGSGNNAVMSIGFRVPSYQSEYRTATDMIVRILGQSGMQSRIVQEVRMKRGLAYNVGGFSSFYKNRGTIGFMAVSEKEKVIEIAKVMIDVLSEAVERGFTEIEIEREKHIMETAMLLSVENITDHLKNIGKCSVMESTFYIENEIRRIRNIQKDELERVAKKLLRENNMGLAVIGDCDIEKLIDMVTLT